MVSESAYEYLLAALLTMAPPSRAVGRHADDAQASEASTNALLSERLDTLGYDVGFRFVEKAVANQYFIGTEPLDIVKFICKEFWEEIFRKKVFGTL